MALAYTAEVPKPRGPKKKFYQPLIDGLQNKKAEFTNWLILTAVKSGCYRITKTGVHKLASHSSLYKNRKQRVTAAAAIVESIVKDPDERRALALVEAGIISPRPDWSKKSFRISAIKRLVEIKPAADLIKEDFTYFGLLGLLRRCRGSPTAALVEAGYVYSEREIRSHSTSSEFGEEKLYPWQRINVPLGFYSKKSNRVAAIRWLLKRGAKALEISENVFCDNGLAGLADYYSTRKLHFPYQALVECGLAYSEKEALAHAEKGEFREDKIYPWERKMANMGYYENEANRIAALKWASWKTRTPLSSLTKEYAKEGCVSYLFQQPYLGWTRQFITSQGNAPQT